MAIVGLHKRFYGKGPVRAKSYLIDSTVVCLLEGGFTVVERTLIDIGRERIVKDLRTEFQAAMHDEFVTVVEAHLGRRVVGYMSQISTSPQMAVELFLLERATTKTVAEFEIEFDDDADVATR
ncbi:MAG TPA: Na-translocating system protein MpsC family protein [Solirubrobacteraceae bacterium]|nr:Na-translocating system protein MpsC family protein [Solirubrobacteraceae bacterium]